MNKWRNRAEGRRNKGEGKFRLRNLRLRRGARTEKPNDPVHVESEPVSRAQNQESRDIILRERHANIIFDGDIETKRPWRQRGEDDILNFMSNKRREEKAKAILDAPEFADEDDIDVALEALKSFDSIQDKYGNDAYENFMADRREETESLPDDEIDCFFSLESKAQSDIEVTLDYFTAMREMMRDVHSILKEME